MKPLMTWQQSTDSALNLLKVKSESADYWVRYFNSKGWTEDAERWRLVKVILDGIIKELGEDNE
jgi:hypothetical protein